MALSFDQARVKELLSRKPVQYSVGGFAAVAGVMGTFVLAPSHSHPQVLAVARQLPPGAVLTRADLNQVDSAEPGRGAVPADQEGAYIGRTLSFGLPVGALLAPGDVGRFPPAGFMTVSLLLKPGQYPQDLTPGQKVGILPLAADGSGALAGQQAQTATGAEGSSASSPGAAASDVVPGELLSLSSAGNTEDGVVAELLVRGDQAAQVAAAPSAALLGTAGAGL
ncbi:hypothetical protein [Actinospica robiniae]|uniref:hypothetical protein n=1 Tax=Actinospica robiniae TaxID=304901 RepID=UPI0004149102|nr:hypothetical protein [Actinospica robiniae]